MILKMMTLLAVGLICLVFATVEADWNPLVMAGILIASFGWIFLFCIANEERLNDYDF